MTPKKEKKFLATVSDELNQDNLFLTRKINITIYMAGITKAWLSINFQSKNGNTLSEKQPGCTTPLHKEFLSLFGVLDAQKSSKKKVEK